MSSKKSLHYSGGVFWWGHTPCLNFDHELEKIHKLANIERNKSEDVNVLLIGSNEPRHILKTITELLRLETSPTKLRFYIVELAMEQLARQMLLMSLVTEPCETFNVLEKATTFLEIFGNTSLSENAAKRLGEKSTELIKFVTNSSDKFSVMKTTNLKHKEIDELENVFKLWRQLDKTSFPISDLWGHRQHWHLGTRYDFRFNIFDWDYHMKLKERGATIIATDEYFHWRETGIAFKTEDFQLLPNTTLASYWMTRKNGLQRGFWGDMVTGPFISFGIECEDQSMFKYENGKFLHKSQDISLANVMQVMQLLQKNSSIIEKFELHLWPPEFLFKYFLQGKYRDHFHLVYFGMNAIQYINPKLIELLNEMGIIMTETSRFMLEWNKANIQDMQNQVQEILQKSGCELIHPCEPLKDNYAAFIRK